MYLLPVYRGYGEKIFFNKAHLFYHVFTSSLQGLWRKNFLIKPPTSSSIQPNWLGLVSACSSMASNQFLKCAYLIGLLIIKAVDQNIRCMLK